MSNIEKIINSAWENKDKINKNSDKSIIDAINEIIEDLGGNLKMVVAGVGTGGTISGIAKKIKETVFLINCLIFV